MALKCTQWLFLEGKEKTSLQKLTGVVIEMQENAWITEELTLRWLQMLWGGVAASRERRMLVWDDFRAHKTARVKACADEVCNTDLVFVPPGCTSLLQAPYLCWNISHSNSDTVSCMMNGASAVRKPTQQQVIGAHLPRKSAYRG